jgi:Uma2 family endonuclease
MMQTVSQKTTLAEFLAMPEIKPANEFVDGSIYQKPMPQGKYSIIKRELTFAIDRPLDCTFLVKWTNLSFITTLAQRK